MSDEKIDKKLDCIIHTQNEMQITLAKQQVILDEHISRTELLETKMEPLTKHLHEFKGAINFLKIIGILAAIAEAIRICIH
jgi:hypothetical protein